MGEPMDLVGWLREMESRAKASEKGGLGFLARLVEEASARGWTQVDAARVVAEIARMVNVNLLYNWANVKGATVKLEEKFMHITLSLSEPDVTVMVAVSIDTRHSAVEIELTATQCGVVIETARRVIRTAR